MLINELFGFGKYKEKDLKPGNIYRVENKNNGRWMVYRISKLESDSIILDTINNKGEDSVATIKISTFLSVLNDDGVEVTKPKIF